jgi:hypothetical protein
MRTDMYIAFVCMRGIITMPRPDPLATAPFLNGLSERVFCLSEYRVFGVSGLTFGKG